LKRTGGKFRKDNMDRIKEFYQRVKKCWELSKRVRLITNSATEVEEIWIETDKEYNRGICQALHRIA
jgi:hypothetical protein